jgi:RNA polymerase sigma factor (sigma-70 family)
MLPDEVHRRASEGDASAISRVVDYHERLVYSTVNRTFMHLGPEEREDAYQEGRLALCKAATCYNVDRGNTFSTYAVKTIKRRVGRAMSGSISPTHLRVPSYMMDTLKKYQREYQAALERTGEEPSEEYMMAAVGKVYGDRNPITREKIRKIHSLMLKLDDGCLSLDYEPDDGDGAPSFSTPYQDDGYDSVETTVLCDSLCSKVRSRLVGCHDDCTACDDKSACPFVIFLLYYAPGLEPAASVRRRWQDEGWGGTKEDIALMLGLDLSEVSSVLDKAQTIVEDIRSVLSVADTLPEISA